jgi:hypothetical protein
MKIEELITMLENKVRTYVELKAFAYQNGDIVEIERLDLEILETENTINKLKN